MFGSLDETGIVTEDEEYGKKGLTEKVVSTANGKYMLTVTAQQQKITDHWFLWFARKWGTEMLLSDPFILPNDRQIPKSSLEKKENFLAVSRFVCKRLGIDATKISYKIFKPDTPTASYNTVGKTTVLQTVTGKYKGQIDEWPHKFRVEISSHKLADYFELLPLMAHELMHVRMLGGNELSVEEEEHEIATDIGILYRGFALFHCQNINADGLGMIYMPGYLTMGVTTYVVALMMILAGKEPRSYKSYMQRSIYHNVVQNYEALTKGGITTAVTPEAFEAANVEFLAYKPESEAIIRGEDETLIELYQERLREKGEGLTAIQKSLLLNNLGYHLTEVGRHSEAVKYLEQSIALLPDWAYPQDNLGYAKMRMGQMDEAWEVLTASQKLDHFNAWVYRNKGIWFMLQGNADAALEQLQIAYTLDTDCEKLHKYFAEAYAMKGDTLKAEESMARYEQWVAMGGHQPIVRL